MKTSFITIVCKRPQMTCDWRTFHRALHNSLYLLPHPTAIPSHPLLHMTLAPNSSSSLLSVKSRPNNVPYSARTIPLFPFLKLTGLQPTPILLSLAEPQPTPSC